MYAGQGRGESGAADVVGAHEQDGRLQHSHDRTPAGRNAAWWVGSWCSRTYVWAAICTASHGEPSGGM